MSLLGININCFLEASLSWCLHAGPMDISGHVWIGKELTAELFLKSCHFIEFYIITVVLPQNTLVILIWKRNEGWQGQGLKREVQMSLFVFILEKTLSAVVTIILHNKPSKFSSFQSQAVVLMSSWSRLSDCSLHWGPPGLDSCPKVVFRSTPQDSLFSLDQLEKQGIFISWTITWAQDSCINR